MTHVHKLVLLGACTILAGLPGCGSSRSVSGTVTFKGELLEQGSIQFFAQNGPPGPSGGAMIRKGKYAMAGDHGLAPGAYIVQISSPVVDDKPGERNMGDFPVTKERIPAEYNAKSTQVVEVTEGANTFNFKID